MLKSVYQSPSGHVLGQGLANFSWKRERRKSQSEAVLLGHWWGRPWHWYPLGTGYMYNTHTYIYMCMYVCVTYIYMCVYSRYLIYSYIYIIDIEEREIYIYSYIYICIRDKTYTDRKWMLNCICKISSSRLSHMVIEILCASAWGLYLVLFSKCF